MQILVATMHQKNYDLLDRLNVQSDAVVINQTDCDARDEFSYKGHNIIWINSSERGVSKSRNMALRNATSHIGLLVDDDEILVDGYPEIIEGAFDLNKDADVIRFQVEGIESIFKNYKNKERKIGYLGSMKMSVVEIAFRLDFLKDKGICFDEIIGSPEFRMGEENTFLFDVLRARGRIYYIPRKIGDIHLGNSTWFTGYNKKYFVDRGASFTSMSRMMAVPLILQFAVRKRYLYRESLTMLDATKSMFKGRKAYIAVLKREMANNDNPNKTDT